MRISYLFNSSLPSNNAGSIQVIKTCEAIKNLSNDIVLISPNTGLNKNITTFYGLKNSPRILKIKFFKSFPRGIKYYLFSLISIIYAIHMKTEIFITRNLFTLFLLVLLKKKTIIEIHHDLANEGRVVKFLFNNLRLLNSKSIIKIIAITESVKKYLIKKHNVDKNKITIVPSASDLKIKFTKFKSKKTYNIGYFGSLEKTKGSEFIIKLSNLDKTNNYYVYGGSKSDVIQLKKKSSSKNLIISEYIPYNKLNYHIRKMDILLMPSNQKFLKSLGGIGNIAKYTSPLKLFDYMASGKLIICTGLKVFNEIVENNKSCIMIKKLDARLWLNKISSLKKKVTVINKIKKNSYTLSKKYTYKIRAKKILNGLNY